MVYDADAHAEENLQTFASLEGREEFFKSAPRITEGANRAFWLIEGKVFPKLTGKGVFTPYHLSSLRPELRPREASPSRTSGPDFE